MLLHIPNAMIMETVRAYYLGWYNDVMTEQLPVKDGLCALAGKPGLGTALRPEVLNRADAHVEVSDEKQKYDASKA